MVGVAYLAVGVVGYAVTGFDVWVLDTSEDLLGFDLNAFHNLVHLGIGAILIAASMASRPAVTQGVLIGGGLVYLLAAFLGFVGGLDELLSIDGTFAADNFLHLASGLLAFGAGFLGGVRPGPGAESVRAQA